VAAGAAFAALLLAAFLLRRDIAHWLVTAAVSSQIPGDLRLGKVTEAGLFHVTARDLVFATKQGEPVISLDEAEVHFDVAALFAGNIEITRARVVGGEVRIEETKSGPIKLERAFSTPSPDKKQEGPLIDIRSVQFADLSVHLLLQGSPAFVIRDVSGALRIRRPPGKAVRLRMERITGVIRNPGILDGVELKKLDGFVHAQVDHVAHIEAEALWSDEPFTLGIDYPYGAEPRLKLDIEADVLSKPMIAGLGLGAAQGFIDILDVDLSVSGSGL
jgi:hypothetical protein